MAHTAWYQCNSKQTRGKNNLLPNSWNEIINVCSHLYCLLQSGMIEEAPQPEVFWEGTVRVFFFQLSLCPCLEMVTTAASRMSSGISSSFSSFERACGATVCLSLSRCEDFSRDPTSSRCLVVFHLLDGFPHLIKSWRDFNIAADWELWDGVENTPTDKIISTKDLEMLFSICVDIFSLTEQFSSILIFLMAHIELQWHPT